MGFCFLQEHLWFDCTNLATELSCNEEEQEEQEEEQPHQNLPDRIELRVWNLAHRLKLTRLRSIETFEDPLQQKFYIKELVLFWGQMAKKQQQVRIMSFNPWFAYQISTN